MSPQVDGSIVYTSNNQLFTVLRDGSNRSMIVDGGVLDLNTPATTRLSNPLWSPDAQTIAFGHKGINFYSVVAGQSTLTLPSPIDSNGFGQMYWPESYSPGGTSCSSRLSPLPQTVPTTPSTTPATIGCGDCRGWFHCCSFHWTADISSIYSGTAFISPFTSAGLWRVDTNSGQMETLLASMNSLKTSTCHYSRTSRLMGSCTLFTPTKAG